MLTDDLTVSVDGHLDPITQPVAAAMETLLSALTALPIGEFQQCAMERLLGSGSTTDLERLMRADEATDWTLRLDDGSSLVVRVSYGSGLTYRQQVGLRFTPERMDLTPVWAVRDQHTGDLATEDGWPVQYATEADASEWIRRQVQNATFQTGPTAAARSAR
ncbi:hypothetical protein ACFZDG_34000 [Kitasatospora xanthocidica]|uniref:hypothetical protein n=1 Tax=Kitasatospora xanthocidica TaxID=83382 RepID=UPI0036E0E209